jgi:hypothetical protein
MQTILHMRSTRPLSSRVWRILVCLTVAFAAGCGPSPADRMNAQLRATGLKKDNVYPLSGTVTIDGSPPPPNATILVMLNDVSKPKLPLKQRAATSCDKEGKFVFTAYENGDGVKPGTYVITFAQVKVVAGYPRGPDQLENRYNDPDKNAQLAEFKIEHQAPGKKDYAFDLKVAGVAPGESPGSFALRGE